MIKIENAKLSDESFAEAVKAREAEIARELTAYVHTFTCCRACATAITNQLHKYAALTAGSFVEHRCFNTDEAEERIKERVALYEQALRASIDKAQVIRSQAGEGDSVLAAAPASLAKIVR